MGGWRTHIESEVSRLRSSSLLRETRVRTAAHHYGCNDYLGLARAGTGEGSGEDDHRGSLLVSGYSEAHRLLEKRIVELKGLSECPGASALLFPSGYAANLSVGMALCALHPGQDPNQEIHVFSDRLNHASIIDGIRFARLASRGKGRVALHVYEHNDARDLERKLVEAEAKNPNILKIVFSESVFSMDGDVCDIRGLVALRRRHDFLFVLDEAHATLVLGRDGGGLAQATGLCREVDVAVGTLSKAVGSLGGFVVVLSPPLRSIILNKGRPLIYSTSLPKTVVLKALRNVAIGISQEGRDLRSKLRRNVRFLATSLAGAGLVPGPPTPGEEDLVSPILPIPMASEEEALEASAFLESRHGIFAPAIRPPTVPTSRLRIAVSALHSERDLVHLVSSLVRFKQGKPRENSKL